MDKRRAERGQTLVELAIVLPCFCLGVFMAVQLIRYCHNMIELQHMAQIMAARQSYSRAQTGYNFFNGLWGTMTPPAQKTTYQRPPVWRPFRGVSTLKETGWFFQTRISTTLLPSGEFSSMLSSKDQYAVAESYFEPPRPVEE